jgi:threonine dehydratase
MVGAIVGVDALSHESFCGIDSQLEASANQLQAARDLRAYSEPSSALRIKGANAGQIAEHVAWRQRVFGICSQIASDLHRIRDWLTKDSRHGRRWRLDRVSL